MPQAPPICGVSYRKIVPSGRKNGCNRYHDARPSSLTTRQQQACFAFSLESMANPSGPEARALHGHIRIRPIEAHCGHWPLSMVVGRSMEDRIPVSSSIVRTSAGRVPLRK